ARAAGRPAANGLGMLVRQGAQAFRLWTGLEPDIEVMTAALHAVKRPELPQVRASRPGP
ncbi:MAG: shikimate dehydrogenase, partial [Chloroflexi bacterium]|nr:shikimate dehydrogenase [Chloroflexota bacterium]MCI0732110.1 shikimate dehydrogenase [Chloroflexota bacterium]